MWIGIWSAVAGLIIGVVIGLLFERTKWQRRELARRNSTEGGESTQVLQSIEALSADVDRLTEGQAFLTKLLSERATTSTAEPR